MASRLEEAADSWYRVIGMSYPKVGSLTPFLLSEIRSDLSKPIDIAELIARKILDEGEALEKLLVRSIPRKYRKQIRFAREYASPAGMAATIRQLVGLTEFKNSKILESSRNIRTSELEVMKAMIHIDNSAINIAHYYAEVIRPNFGDNPLGIYTHIARLGANRYAGIYRQVEIISK